MRKFNSNLLLAGLGTVLISGVLVWEFFFSQSRHYTVEVIDPAVNVLAFEVSRGKTNEFYYPSKSWWLAKTRIERIGLGRFIHINAHYGQAHSKANTEMIWLRAYVDGKHSGRLSAPALIFAHPWLSAQLRDEAGHLIAMEDEEPIFLSKLIGAGDGLEEIWTLLPSRRTNLNHCTLELFSDKGVVVKIHIQE